MDIVRANIERAGLRNDARDPGKGKARINPAEPNIFMSITAGNRSADQ